MNKRTLGGYHILVIDTPRRHQGGINVFYRDAPHFQVEAYQQHSTNVESFQVASRGWRWFTVGCYITRDDVAMIEGVVAAIGKKPTGKC